MASNLIREREFSDLLDRFAGYIRFHVHKFNLAKYGLDPEDIIQDIRLRLWRLLSTEKTVANYASYIRKIVNSAIIDQLRKWKREEGVFKAEKKKITELELGYNPEVERLNKLKDMIAAGVEALIESRRQVVKLYLLGMSIEEIACYLRWTQDKTRNLLYRGLADLKVKLKDKGIEYEDK